MVAAEGDEGEEKITEGGINFEPLDDFMEAIFLNLVLMYDYSE